MSTSASPSTRRAPAWRKVTTLARVIDIRYASNRFIVFAAAVALLMTALIMAPQGDFTLTDGLGRGATNAIGLLLGWAIGRELDPDWSRTARYGVFLAIPALFLGPPALGGLGLLLLALRIVSRSTGALPTVVDLGLIAFLCIAAARTPVGAGIAAVVSIGLLATNQLPGKRDPRLPLLAGLLAVGTLAAVVIGESLTGWHAPTPLAWLVVLLAIASTSSATHEQVHARTDLTGDSLDPDRLQAARVLGSITAAVAVLAAYDNPAAAAPALGAVFALTIRRYTNRAASDGD